MNINDIEDRTQFENTRLIPALKTMYCGVFGEDKPIICGSTSLYLQGIYFDDFPNDIDIMLDNEYSVECKIKMMRPIVKRFGFNCDALPYKCPEQYKKIINIDGVDIRIQDAYYTINHWIPFLIDVYIERNNIEKVDKHKQHLRHIKENYPDYFDEKNNIYLDDDETSDDN